MRQGRGPREARQPAWLQMERFFMATAPKLGDEIAGYRLDALIEHGATADIYLATQTSLGRQVELKLLAWELEADDRFRQRFIRESQMAASLEHPNIVPVYSAGADGELLYIASKHIEGVDLKALVAREGSLDVSRALSIVAQIASALDRGHALGLLHRDVRTSSILVSSITGPDRTEQVYLTDFGLAKPILGESGLSMTGQFAGTVGYVAPEQIVGDPVGARSDQYSLGCVLFECITSRLPFMREADAAVLWAHLHDRPSSVTELDPRLPVALDAVFARVLAKAPKDRYESCMLFVAAARTVSTNAAARPGA